MNNSGAVKSILNGLLMLVLICVFIMNSNEVLGQSINLQQSTIIIKSEVKAKVVSTAAIMLQEEVEKRTDLKWQIKTDWPKQGNVIVLFTGVADRGWKSQPELRTGTDLAENRPEGYRLFVQKNDDGTSIIWIKGADGRGVLFGAGHLLRLLDWGKEQASLNANTDIATAPAYPIRGHQLGYRDRANSYDSWTPEVYEQYIRDLALFGTNCIENIPFEDERQSKHMPISREEMNIRMSEICDKYDLDYWVWAPADFDLNDQEKRRAALKKHGEFFKACPRLDAVFFPGGDPGDNHPRLVMPYLEEVSQLLIASHPNARMWVSLQGFDDEQTDYFHDYIDTHLPDWFGGLVSGPSSPPIPESRKRLPAKYGLRHYPDITHTTRCQYPVSWWDPAYALTMGRECANPQPVYYGLVHNWLAPYTNGFLTYSDGIHDDVNKIIWSARGWNPDTPVRDILVEYARVFFRADLAESAADGILALERNWEGALAVNGSVEATHTLWNDLGKQAPELAANWRWQLCQLNSVYETYTRRRLIYESELESQANRILRQSATIGSEKSMNLVLALIAKTDQWKNNTPLRGEIENLCDALFLSIGLQTSVSKYHASGGERGAVLDYVDYPLNNRWWLEDEFAKVKNLSGEKEKCMRLAEIGAWEYPGPGGYYDDLGNPEKSTHVVRGEHLETDPLMLTDSNPGHWWWNNGFSRERLSWQVTMDWPKAVRYVNLDPKVNYVVRMTGYGEALTKMNGKRVEPSVYNKGLGEIKEFPVPQAVIDNGVLEITWDVPDEHQMNWRQQSRIAEIWLLKQ